METVLFFHVILQELDTILATVGAVNVLHLGRTPKDYSRWVALEKLQEAVVRRHAEGVEIDRDSFAIGVADPVATLLASLFEVDNGARGLLELVGDLVDWEASFI